MVALEQECQRAQGRIQELLEEGPELQTEHKELQIMHTVKVAQLEGQLKVGQIERDGLQKQLQMEADFSRKRAVEINRLGKEIKRLDSEREELRSDKDKLEAEVQNLKDCI